jgi:hypothetical protein
MFRAANYTMRLRIKAEIRRGGICRFVAETRRLGSLPCNGTETSALTVMNKPVIAIAAFLASKVLLVFLNFL